LGTSASASASAGPAPPQLASASLAPAANDHPQEVSPLAEATCLWHEAMTMQPDTHVEFLDALRGFARRVNGVCKVGTLFSGSDMIKPVFHALSDYWKYTYDVSVRFEFLFAAERDELKQSFLHDHGEAQLIFRTAEDCLEAVAENCITGEQVVVPWVHWLWAGFPCVSKSKANTSRGQHKNCIRDATGDTGVGFSTVVKYVEKARPLIVSLENLVTLMDGDVGESDSDYMCDAFRSMSYWPRCFAVEASEHGSPATRERAYWINVADKQDGDDSLALFLSRCLVATKLHYQPFGMDHFVISDDAVRAKVTASLEELFIERSSGFKGDRGLAGEHTGPGVLANSPVREGPFQGPRGP